jgi:predicted N-acetyltransferase YhbS
MSLQVAELNDILLVLRDNFGIWSQGLTRSDYRAFMAIQLRDSWLRNHFCYLVYKMDGQIAASCKVYYLDFVTKGQNLKVACLGAVYTQSYMRNRGFAKKLLEGVIDNCKSRGIDAIMLFSDIDPSFYETFGFMEVGGYDFFIDLPELNEAQTEALSMNMDDVLQRRGFSSALDRDKISRLSRHHRRWLSRQAYGIERSEQYFRFKFVREKFLSKCLGTGRTELQVLSFDSSAGEFAYTITKVSGKIMRVFEVIGSEAARLELWAGLFDVAKDMGLSHITGWESAIGDLAPGFSSSVSIPSYKFETGAPKIACYERDWGKPMILPISETAVRLSDSWISTYPCPLLELDF